MLFQKLLFLHLETDRKYNLASVLSCFAHLQHHRVVGKKMPALFIAMQRSGNCAVKSTNCLMLDLLDDSIALKRISLDVRTGR